MPRLFLTLLILIPLLPVEELGNAQTGVSTMGYLEDFANSPVASTWTSFARVGLNTDIYDMDSEVNNTITAALVTNAVVITSAAPPLADPLATWSSTGHYVQTRPTANRYTVLMARFSNNTGTNIDTLTISYRIAAIGAGATEEAAKGTRVYYSLSGTPNSWTNIPALNNIATSRTNNVVASLFVKWARNSNLYLLWVDDNAPGNPPDSGNQISSFALEIGMVPSLVWRAGATQFGGMAIDKLGNVFVSHYAPGTPSGLHFTKISASDGSTMWDRTYNPPANANQLASTLLVDNNGDLLAAGTLRFPDTTNGVPIAVFASKFSGSGGGALWSKYRYGEKTNEALVGVVQDASNNVILAGSSVKTIAGVEKASQYFAKYAGNSGNLIWERYAGEDSIGGINGILLDNQNNIVGSGLVRSNGNSWETRFDRYIAKFSGVNGSLLWEDVGAIFWGGQHIDTQLGPFTVDLDANVIVSDGVGFQFAKYGSGGNELWKKILEPFAALHPISLQTDPSGDIFMVGDATGTNFIAKFSGKTGNRLWLKVINRLGDYYDKKIGPDGALYVTVRDTTSGFYSIDKLSTSDGSVIWHKRLQHAALRSLAFGPENTLYAIAPSTTNSSEYVLAKFSLAPVNLYVRRVSVSALNAQASDAMDAPIAPTPLPALLGGQPSLGVGSVADGVTPVLFEVALNVPATSTNIFYLTFTTNGGMVKGSLVSKLHVLQGSPSSWSWSQAGLTNRLVIMPGQTNTFAYLDGIATVDLSNTLDMTITAVLSDSTGPISTQSYLVRKPPVVLVHGYNAAENTWTDEFLNVLRNSRGSNYNFVLPITYGATRKPDGSFDCTKNTRYSFDVLASMLGIRLIETIEDEDQEPRRSWSFLRYDIVAHSQGGVLSRILCRKEPYNWDAHFYSPFYPRARFHRIITIGSPHNGSVIPYYLDQMAKKNYQVGNLTSIYFVLPVGLSIMDLIQEKFNPFGTQIQSLNSTTIDERAKFHTIRGTFDLPPNIATLNETILGLLATVPAGVAGPQPARRKDILLPFGSDSVVDLDSQAGGPGTHNTTVLNQNVIHAPAPGPSLASFALFGVPAEYAETHNEDVAALVVQLLDGPSDKFGPFYNPISLTQQRKSEIDAIIPTSWRKDLIQTFLVPHNFQGLAPAPAGTTQITATLIPSPELPMQGAPNWSVVVLGAAGETAPYLNIVTNASEAARVSIAIPNSLVGDVVLYASYIATNGDVVLADPKLLFSAFPIAAEVVGIVADPATIAVEVGEHTPIHLFARVSTGAALEKFIGPGSGFSFTSGNSNILTVTEDGFVNAITEGSASVTVTFSNWNAAVLVNVYSKPGLSGQSTNQILRLGSNILLTATLQGGAQFSGYWQKDGVLLSGQTNTTLIISNASALDTGLYRFIASGIFGTVATTNIFVKVLTPKILSSPVVNTNGTVRIRVGHSDGSPVGSNEAQGMVLQSTTNFEGLTWQTLSNRAILTNGSYEFRRTSETSERRLYRLLEH